MRLQVIAPEEIIDPSADEQSVMTYLSQFPKAKLKPGAPLKPKLNPKKARAYGPGTRTNLQHKIKIFNTSENTRVHLVTDSVICFSHCV